MSIECGKYGNKEKHATVQIDDMSLIVEKYGVKVTIEKNLFDNLTSIINGDVFSAKKFGVNITIEKIKELTND